jgi:hypothetical protein
LGSVNSEAALCEPEETAWKSVASAWQASSAFETSGLVAVDRNRLARSKDSNLGWVELDGKIEALVLTNETLGRKLRAFRSIVSLGTDNSGARK